MDVETALRQIDEANNKHVGPEGYDEDRAAYERTFSEVEEIGDGDALEELVGRVAMKIREADERPDPEAVETDAVDVLTEKNIDIPEGSPLSEKTAVDR
ncbi:hypothetical protein ACNS7O_09375 [Haloferacaceae archaeon DSL9]